ncbi:SixA phosphatase family protein [Adhaeribacter radiodurans]|uniref:Histidine phosphatase family protein n=1 Tax=Adhaeribacter radiodurans TaxID=2745197 RepID=A0A7L7LAY5_9BACT|nr:histidine phosphatase family protein [Adhaeribacter radiodurans]QMU29913.1 histidine phosphatase family protein [Adhaeribacter radiodurans]
MKTLYLLRHAKSSWDFDELSDHDRPLNNRGRDDAPLMGRELLSREIALDLIVSSSAVRALTTASLVAKELEYDTSQIVIDENIYGAGKEELYRIIQKFPDDVDNILLVGHNPEISDLANMLSPEHITDMPTAAVVSLRFACFTWKEITPENATLLFYDFPKNHK